MQTPREERAQEHGGHPPWMMALCLLPVAAIVAVSVFQVSVSTVLFLGLFLLCPLMHLFMGGHGQGGGHAEHGGHGTAAGRRAGE